MDPRLTELQSLIDAATPRTRWGFAGPAEVRRITSLLERARAHSEALLRQPQPPADPRVITLAALRAEIDALNASQPNAPLLDAIRAYNHTIVDALHQTRPLPGLTVLDVGASPHGYALEHALDLGAAHYVGIGLDVDAPLIVHGPAGRGELHNQNAESLAFEDERFDLVLSMSTFEHVAHVDRVLREIWRVLKPGGQALVTFEPIWTCAYGHHLHHFGPVSALVPDWAHLLWSKGDMLTQLAGVWPADAPLTLAAAAEWVYDGPAINRVGLGEMRRHFERSPLKLEWMLPLKDDPRDPERLALAARTLGMDPDDLTTKGLSVMLKKA